jgi:hypothetical protein
MVEIVWVTKLMIVPVTLYEVTRVVVVTFEKVSVRTTVLTWFGMRPLRVVVTVTSIGLTAGAFTGTRTASPARITHVITMTLITSCLFKSVLSRCWV